MADILLTSEQEAEAQRIAAIIAKKAKEEALAMAPLLVSKNDREILGATEFEIRDRVHKLGAYALPTTLSGKRGYQGSSLSCPHCHTGPGSSSIAPRASSAWSATCVFGAPTTIAAVPAGSFSLGQDIRLVATADAGGRGSDGVGGRAGEFRQGGGADAAQAGGPSPERSDGGTDDGRGGGAIWGALSQGGGVRRERPWEWNRAAGQTCAYVSLDATGMLMQGPEGTKVEGRMVYVGMIYNPQPRQPDEEALSRPCDGVRYLAGLYTLGELGLQMRRQGAGGHGRGRAVDRVDGRRQRPGGIHRREFPAGGDDPGLPARGDGLGDVRQAIRPGVVERNCWRRGATRSSTPAGRC